MSRSAKKGPYVDERLLKRINAMNATGDKKMLKTWSRSSTIFPEMVDTGNPAADVGMDITFVTSAKDNKGARELLTILGAPFAGK